MYETIRIVGKLRPKYVIWENVKNVLSEKHKHNFENYLNTMKSLGYTNFYQVLNAKDYGVPQNRERVFTISILNGDEFNFPLKEELKIRLKDILEDEVEEKYYLDNTQIDRIKNSTFITNQRRIQEKDYCDTLCARDWKDPKCVRIGGIFDTENSTHQAGSIYDKDGIAPTLDTMEGGWRQPSVIESDKCILAGNLFGGKWDNTLESSKRVYDENGISPTIPTCQGGNTEPKILTHEIKQIVKVRKYEVDIEKLKETLRNAKIDRDISNQQIADKLNVPITTIEHYFRKDNCFAIPTPDIWQGLKEILNIATDEFDESIMTFEERDGVYEKSNRIYDENGIAPTLTQQQESILTGSYARNFGSKGKMQDENNVCDTLQAAMGNGGGNVPILNKDFRIRKLTPKECWRLMGFTDEEFGKAQAVPTSNTQLYKQARKLNSCKCIG